MGWPHRNTPVHRPPMVGVPLPVRAREVLPPEPPPAPYLPFIPMPRPERPPVFEGCDTCSDELRMLRGRINALEVQLGHAKHQLAETGRQKAIDEAAGTFRRLHNLDPKEVTP